MANKELKTRIKNKRDAAVNWEFENPVILNGEIILVDTNTGELRAKVGDGTKHYKDLPFSDEVLKNLISNSNSSTLSSAGEPDDWNKTFLIPAMLKLIQDQKKEIEGLKEDVNELKELLGGR